MIDTVYILVNQRLWQIEAFLQHLIGLLLDPDRSSHISGRWSLGEADLSQVLLRLANAAVPHRLDQVGFTGLGTIVRGGGSSEA